MGKLKGHFAASQLFEFSFTSIYWVRQSLNYSLNNIALIVRLPWKLRLTIMRLKRKYASTTQTPSNPHPSQANKHLASRAVALDKDLRCETSKTEYTLAVG